MKLIALSLALVFSLPLLAADKAPCKSEAHLAAYERYTYSYPDAMVSLSAKYQAVVRDGEVYHTVQVIDMESGQATLMGVILDAKTCRVKAVN